MRIGILEVTPEHWWQRRPHPTARIRIVDDIGAARAEVVKRGAEVCHVRQMQEGSEAIVACTSLLKGDGVTHLIHTLTPEEGKSHD